MKRKITVRLDEEMASKLDELSEKTQIPKVRLTQQAYNLLLEAYAQLERDYDPESVNLNFMNILRSRNGKDQG